MTRLIHKISKDKIESAIITGLLTNEVKDIKDDEINRTDELINHILPKKYIKVGINRKSNIYCYLTYDNYVIDIESGNKVDVKDLRVSPTDSLLYVDVDPTKCFVSDLDIYDQIKNALINNELKKAKQLAVLYLKKLQRLSDYNHKIMRPEVMVTYNISPSNITKLT